MKFSRAVRYPITRQVLVLVWAIMLAGCARAPSVLAPASPNASMIARLTWIIFGIAAVVFVVVEGALIYAAVRFSRRKIEGLPAQVEGNRRLEIAWIVAPALVLLLVFIISLFTLRVVGYFPSTQRENTFHVRVIGHQWWWEFDYPDLKIKTANELHVPVGSNVELDLESVDVIHSFWIPQLAGKTDVIPGHVNHTWFEATTLGTYHGQCAEFCGVEHANMQIDVIIESAADFQAWTAQQQAPVATMAGVAAKGEQLFLKSACIGCHTIDGTQAQGVVGPNLTHFASRKIFAGATVENTPENLANWLKDPQQVKPGNKMPNLQLGPDSINQLVAFLDELK